MKVILHMGTPKTGTTALQNALTSSADCLRKAKFFFEQYPYTSNHVVFLDREKRRFMETYQTYGDNGCHIVSEEQMYIYPVHNFIRFLLNAGKDKLLTVEKYCDLRERFLRKLRNIYSGNDIDIVLYLRRQDSFLESWTKQIVKTLKVGVPLGRVKDYLSIYCDYEMNLNLIKSVFHDANITVRIYDKKYLAGGNSIADFAACTRIPIPEKYFAIKKNTSHSWDAMLMKMLYEQYAQGRSPVRDVKYLLDIFDSVREKKTVRLFSYEDRCSILKFFEHSNRNVARKWFGRDVLFDAPAIEADDSGAVSLEPAEQIRIFAGTLECILDDLEKRRWAVRRCMRTIQAAGLFDEEFYRESYLLGRQERYTPLEHFLLFGAEKGYQPNPDFNTAWYVSQHPEIRMYGVNPLVYHILVGKEKNFPTSPEAC